MEVILRCFIRKEWLKGLREIESCLNRSIFQKKHLLLENLSRIHCEKILLNLDIYGCFTYPTAKDYLSGFAH